MQLLFSNFTPPPPAALGWKAQTPLERGVRETVAWFQAQLAAGKEELRM